LLPGLPASYAWRNSPADWSVKDGALTIKAAGHTDWFVSPIDGETRANSAVLLFPAAKEFSVSAKVTVDFHSAWDAGVLAIYADESHWAKFCFELSMDNKPTVLSVVTRGMSDDSSAMTIEGNTVYLKIAHVQQALFLYLSKDGKKWTAVRVFNLGSDQPLRFGFSAQSPTGSGSTATFSEIQYKPERLANFWTGE
jgi:regulation of enolase protein 1 (concanavalin A-like superfamily)